jgi:hypothetical protein
MSAPKLPALYLPSNRLEIHFSLGAYSRTLRLREVEDQKIFNLANIITVASG